MLGTSPYRIAAGTYLTLELGWGYAPSPGVASCGDVTVTIVMMVLLHRL